MLFIQAVWYVFTSTLCAQLTNFVVISTQIRLLLAGKLIVHYLKTFGSFCNSWWNHRFLSCRKTESSSGAMRCNSWRGVEGMTSEGACLNIGCRQ